MLRTDRADRLRPGPHQPHSTTGGDRGVADWNGDDLIRGQLLSAEALERHAEAIAADQPVSDRRQSSRWLTVRLRSNEATLLAGYRAIAKAVADGRPITPAAEWLVDNYHLVEDQIREIRLDLPPGYYRQLPKLAEGPLKDLPRVFGLAGTSSPIPIAASTPTCSAASSTHISVSNRSRSASCGRLQSRCASCWSKISAVRPAKS